MRAPVPSASASTGAGSRASSGEDADAGVAFKQGADFGQVRGARIGGIALCETGLDGQPEMVGEISIGVMGDHDRLRARILQLDAQGFIQRLDAGLRQRCVGPVGNRIAGSCATSASEINPIQSAALSGSSQA